MADIQINFKKLTRKILFIIFRVLLTLAYLNQVAFFCVLNHEMSITSVMPMLVVASMLLIIFFSLLPEICCLSNKMLIFINIIITMLLFRDFYISLAFNFIYHLTNIEIYTLEDSLLVNLLFIPFVFLLMRTRNRYSSGTKSIKIDLKSEQLKHPIKDISDIKSIILTIDIYVVLTNDTGAKFKILNTITAEWMDITASLKNDVIEITSEANILKKIISKILNSTRATVIIELENFIEK